MSARAHAPSCPSPSPQAIRDQQLVSRTQKYLTALHNLAVQLSDDELLEALDSANHFEDLLASLAFEAELNRRTQP